jgi:hypothetical protein
MPALPIWLWILLGGAGTVVVAKALSSGSSTPKAVLRREKITMTEPPQGVPRAISPCNYPTRLSAEQADFSNAQLRDSGSASIGYVNVNDMCQRFYGPPLVVYDEEYEFGATDVNGCALKPAIGVAIDLEGNSYWWADKRIGCPRAVRDAGWAILDDNYEPGWGEKFTRAMTGYVIPAIAAYVGAVVPGGVFIAAAIIAYGKIAAGATITDAIVTAAKERLGGVISKSVFGDTYRMLESNRYTASTVAKLRHEVAKKFDFDKHQQKDALLAFDNAALVGRGQRVQKLAIDEIKKRLDRPQASAWLDRCMAKGVPLMDWVYVYGGRKAGDLTGRILEQAAAYVEAGEPAGIQPWQTPPTVLINLPKPNPIFAIVTKDWRP